LLDKEQVLIREGLNNDYIIIIFITLSRCCQDDGC